MDNDEQNQAVATLVVAFYTLQNAATQLTVASVLAPPRSELRDYADGIAAVIEEQTSALAEVLDATRSMPPERERN